MVGAEQGTQEWKLERAGHATSSRFKDILAKAKSGDGESVSRKNYRIQLVTERLTGEPQETFRNASTDWGNAQEALAKQTLEIVTGRTVMKSPFVRHPTIQWCGASPDGLINGDGLVQIKCPHVSTHHIEYMESGSFPSEYRAQIQGEMWVTGRQWSMFTSFDPRMPEHLQLYTYIVRRDERYIAELEVAVKAFLRTVEDMHGRLLSKKVENS